VPAFAMGKRHKDAVLAPQGIGVQVPSSTPIQKINKIREGQPETVGLLFRHCSCFCSGCRKVGDVTTPRVGNILPINLGLGESTLPVSDRSRKLTSYQVPCLILLRKVAYCLNSLLWN
jgi:hypothetical protein